MRVAFFMAAALLLPGCATVTTGTTQGVRFETIRLDGTAVPGADCTAVNSRRTSSFRSGGEVKIRRAGSDLVVKCTSDGLPDAQGRLVVAGNYVGLGNILIGGVAGTIVDASTGANFKYPAWVRLVFGELRIFNLREDKTREPMLGVVDTTSPAADPVITAAAAPAAESQPAVAPSTAAPPEATTVPTPTPTIAPAPTPPGSNWRNWGKKGASIPL